MKPIKMIAFEYSACEEVLGFLREYLAFLEQADLNPEKQKRVLHRVMHFDALVKHWDTWEPDATLAGLLKIPEKTTWEPLSKGGPGV